MTNPYIEALAKKAGGLFVPKQAQDEQRKKEINDMQDRLSEISAEITETLIKYGVKLIEFDTIYNVMRSQFDKVFQSQQIASFVAGYEKDIDGKWFKKEEVKK